MGISCGFSAVVCFFVYSRPNAKGAQTIDAHSSRGDSERDDLEAIERGDRRSPSAQKAS